MSGRLIGGVLMAALLMGCAARPRPELFPYRVVCGETKGKLAEVVSEWMRRGWQPRGGVSIFRDQDGRHYCQSVLKEEIKGG